MKKAAIAKRESKRIIAQDVADEAGVSVSAVSRTFTPGASVSKAMCEKVLAATEKLGYQPNILARSLMTRQTNLVGILIRDFKNPAYLKIIDTLSKSMQDRGLQALVINVAVSAGIGESVRRIMQYQADGLIETSGGPIDAKLLSECKKKRLPLVQLGFHSRRRKTTGVCCDNVEGGRQAARLLLDSGYRKLAYIGEAAEGSASTDRGKGFAAGLAERGRKRWIQHNAADWTYDAGYKAARQLLGGSRRVDGIFCADDIIAMGAMDAARSEFGLDVPQDLGIIGFDDILLADSKAYSLTTIHQPYEHMIELALNLLCERIDDPSLEPELKVVSGTLIERSSHRRKSR